MAARDGQLKYGELDRKSNRLARFLRSRGVGPECFVGIALERSLDLAVALLGVLKAGAAYIPLDVKYPAERLKFVVEDSNMDLALTHSAYGVDLPLAEERRVFIDGLDLRVFSDEPLDDLVGPASLAYCIYTSGSTGKPKGVLVEHGAVCNTVRWYARYLGLTPEDRLFWINSFSFDVSICEFWPALLVGGRSVLSSPGAPLDPELLFGELAACRATVLEIVPSVLSTLLIQPDISALASLRHVVSGGEAMSGNLRDRFRECCGAQLHNVYGPTETAVWVTGSPVEAADVAANVPIGRPIDNVTIEILDEGLNRVSPGQVGEIYIGGVNVARGYLNRPDLTAARFLRDPFGPPGARMYRAGDLGRWLPDGRIECLGRVDDQVKVRGFRIELGEITAAIVESFPVADAAVIVIGESEADRSLAAFVVPNPAQADGDPAPSRVIERLRERLPAYMVPSRMFSLERLPVTPNGKLDRKALAELARFKREAAPVEPMTLTEGRIVSLMGEVLGAPIGPRENFFDFGGTSLQALRLSSLIEERVRRRIPAALVYRHPTPAALAEVLDRTAEDAKWTPLFPLNQGGREPPIFCLHGFEGTVDNYIHLAYRLDGLVSLVGVRVDPNWRQSHIRSVDRLVDIYEAEILATRRKGPFWICGYSYGGVPAFELACRLEKRGEAVTLVLLDAHPQTQAILAKSWLPRIFKMVQVRDVLGTLRRKIDELVNYELYYWRHGWDRDVDHGLKRAAFAVKHGRFNGRVILFQSVGVDDERSIRLELDGVNGWKEHVARSIEVVSMDSGHVGLVHEPHVSQVAAKLRELLGSGESLSNGEL